VETTALARLVEHAPADQIVTVEAGMRLGALQRHLAAHRQRLALDVAHPERATIGGILAANGCGALRTGFGSARDLVIGASFIRADGARVKTGGKVVKNVAGFDLAKLLIGSLGTLGMITSATFRLHPLPETEQTLVFALADAEAGWTVARALRHAQLEPAACALVGDGDGWTLGVRYEGFAAGVAQQRARTVALAPAGGRPLDGAAAAALWAREAACRGEGALRLKLAAPPGRFGALAVGEWAALAQLVGGARIAWYPLVGLGFAAALALAPEAAPDVAAAVAALRARLVAEGGSLVVHAAPPALRALVDVWGPPPPALPLMRAVKTRFDPARRLGPGRFVGGL